MQGIGTWIAQLPPLIAAIKGLTSNLADLIEIFAALIIMVAAFEGIARAAVLFARRETPLNAKEDLRLRFARWLAVALEFELGADVLRTAVAPSWAVIGQLAAIAAIRTGLNFFLEREIRVAARQQLVIPMASPSVQQEPREEIARRTEHIAECTGTNERPGEQARPSKGEKGAAA